MSVEIEVKINGKAALAGDVLPRISTNTGSAMLVLPGKVTINGVPCQANVQFTAIGSKAMSEAERATVLDRLGTIPGK